MINRVNNKIAEIKSHAKQMRKKALCMAYSCSVNAHIGTALSMMDAMAVLYGSVMNTCNSDLNYSQRDKFILSKGHGVLGLYAALAEFGLISDEVIDTFLQDGSDLIAHPVMKPELGIEASTGSLGQGISLGVGIALASKIQNYSYHTYVMCGNGECNEGSVWEACMAAVNYHLDNFTLFIDDNSMQSDGSSETVMNISDKYSDMLNALGFQTITINGNDVAQLIEAFEYPHEIGKPKAIIGKTIKGKGISFMENNNAWHHNRLTKEQYELAIAELR